MEQIKSNNNNENIKNIIGKNNNTSKSTVTEQKPILTYNTSECDCFEYGRTDGQTDKQSVGRTAL